MSISIAEFLQLLFNAAWRRRALILGPILVFGVLCALSVKLWPRTYASHALIMLQERENSDPLSATSNGWREGRLRADELEALLKSQRVLVGAILDMRMGKPNLTDTELENEIKDLKHLLSVRVVGSEFIQIELRDNNPKGLADRLSAIMTRFFERILHREEAVKTARQFAMEQRHRNLEESRVRIVEWITRNAPRAAQSPSIQQAAAEAAEKTAGYVAARSRLQELARAYLPEPVDTYRIAQFVMHELRVSGARKPGGVKQPAAAPGLQDLKDLEAQLVMFQVASEGHLKAQGGYGQTIADEISTLDEDARAIRSEWQGLRASANETIALYESHVQSTKRSAGPGTTPLGLLAPEAIRVIDEPRDPVLPITSILKILVAFLGAGIALGIGLATLAEQLDDRLHSVNDLSRLTGVKSILRVPRMIDLSSPERSAAIDEQLEGRQAL